MVTGSALFKPIGAHRVKRHGFEQLDVATDSDHYADRYPLPSGSVSVDVSLTDGGLSRSSVTAVTATQVERADRFVHSVIAETQRRGGRAVAVDFDHQFTAANLKRSGVDYTDLALVRFSEQDDPDEAIQHLLDGQDYDLVVLNMRYMRSDAIPDFLSELHRSASDQPGAVLVNLGAGGRNLPDGLPVLILDLVATPGRAPGGDALDTTVRMVGTSAEARITQLVSGSRLASELLDLGVDRDLIDRTGNTYRAADVVLGRGRLTAVESIESNRELLQSLRTDFERRALAARLSSVGGHVTPETDPPPSTATRGRPTSSRDTGGGRYVNTWFESDHEPVLPLAIDHPYELNLRIGRREQHGAGAAIPMSREPDFGGHDGIVVVASLYSADFSAAVSTKSFWLPVEGESDLVSFALVPLRVGDASIRVLLSTDRELEPLQEIQLTVPVTSGAALATV